MTIVGRRKFNHPALAAAGGSGLHAAIELIYTTISNDLGGRYYARTGVADSTSEDLDHNFGIDSADVGYALYTGTHPNLTRVSNPAGAGWTIAPTVGLTKTKTTITAPNSGGPHDFVLFIFQTQGGSGGGFDDVQSFSAGATIATGTTNTLVKATTGGGGITLVLPAAAANSGRRITFKKVDAGAGVLTIDGASSETIDGALTAALGVQYGFMTVQSDGSNWHIVA